jgi:hypothetical protein
MKRDEFGGFEERLLSELRNVVVDGPRPERPLRRPRRLVLAGSLASVAVVAAVAGVLLLTGGASPAYAVNKNDDGTVTVEIDSLRDAAGLERKLHEAGVRALVQYLPPGKACKQPWPETSTAPPDLGSEKGMIKGGVLHTQDGHTRFTVSDNLPADLTLVVMTQTGAAADGPEAIGISFARGDVRPCEVVDSTAGIEPFGAPPPGAQVHVEHEQSGAERAPVIGK